MPASEKYSRNLETTHIVFALSSFALLAVTLWMMADDYSTEWRGHQQTVDELNHLKLQAGLDDAMSGDYSDELAQLESQIAVAQAKLDSEESVKEIETLTAKIAELALIHKQAEGKARSRRAHRDVSRADYDLGVRDELSAETLADRFDKFTADQDEVNRLEKNAEKSQQELNAEKGELNEIRNRVEELKAELSNLQSRENQIKEAMAAIVPEYVYQRAKRGMLDWPILDGFSNVHRIQLDWLPNLHIKLGMAKTARFDRCRTCHLSIDRVEAGDLPMFPHGEVDSENLQDWVDANKFPHPYATHPRPELYLTAASPHPVQTFGCTICHDGQGSATNFNNAQHGPNNPHQEEEWEKEFHHHYNHYWEYPMLPKRFQEASCLKCHHDVVELGVNPKFGPSAPKLYRGYQLLQKYGCFGCHEIHGFTGEDAIGPDLRLEPNYNAAALELLNELFKDKSAAALELLNELFKDKSDAKAVKEIRRLAGKVAEAPVDSSRSRARLFALLVADSELPSPLLSADVHRLADSFKDDAKAIVEIRKLAGKVAEAPVDSVESRQRLFTLLVADSESPSQLLSADVHRLADSFKDMTVPGRYRKVGPSLRYIAEKTTPAWITYWTEEPKRFRPSTRMPQFFGNTNQQDAHAAALMPVELAAIAQYLTDKSQPFVLDSPDPGYKQDEQAVKRGKKLFSEKGCLACHTHKDFPDLNAENFPNINADFGPDLSRVHEKLKAGQKGFGWLYSWIRDPKRYHPRTKMPNLFLTPEKVGEEIVDPAADIATYLLDGSPGPYEPYVAKPYVAASYLGLDVEDSAKGSTGVRVARVMPLGPASRATDKDGKLAALRFGDVIRKIQGKPVNSAEDLQSLTAGRVSLEIVRNGIVSQRSAVVADPLDDMVRLFLTKAIGIQPAENFLKTKKYPGDAADIKGDEIELLMPEDVEDAGKLTSDQWQQMKLNYVGRRTISRYGCYGCHDIPGFEGARPIGTTLQDWGRKDTSKLALEHIAEYLHHHGEPRPGDPDGSSTHDRVDRALKSAKAGGLAAEEFDSAEEEDREMSAASLYTGLQHHRREGFLWQKLRQPRSYDYRKIETKGYEERLRMPKFPFNEEQIEAISTFVLGLVAESPSEQYVYQPTGAARARIDGEFLLEKYNCTSCHMLELPQASFALEASGGHHPFAEVASNSVGNSADEIAEWFVVHRKSLNNARKNGGMDFESYPEFTDMAEWILRQADAFKAEFERVEKANEGKDREKDELEEVDFEGLFPNAPSNIRFMFRMTALKGVVEQLEAAGVFTEEPEESESKDAAKVLLKQQQEAIAKWLSGQKLVTIRDDVQLMQRLGAPLDEIIQLTNDHDIRDTGKAGLKKLQDSVRTWMAEHPQYMLAAELKEGEFPQGVARLLALKPPVSGETGLTRKDGVPIVRFHGLLNVHLEDEYPEDEVFSYQLWDTLDVGGRILLPGSNMSFSGLQINRDSMRPARGGAYSEWLVEKLAAVRSGKSKNDRGWAWTMSPPPLYLEGIKVQTPWLYKFLKNPHVIRHETVLRMPRFNLDDAEARALANYFSAVDDSEFPYQNIPQREPAYLNAKKKDLAAVIPNDSNYLSESWKLLNANVCMGCHSVGGKTFQAGSDSNKVTHGPDLNRVHERLRPEWLALWLSKPTWVTPYTKMIVPKAERSLFDENGPIQSEALRDALLNYPLLLERKGDGPIFYDPKTKTVLPADKAVAAPAE